MRLKASERRCLNHHTSNACGRQLHNEGKIETKKRRDVAKKDAGRGCKFDSTRRGIDPSDIAKVGERTSGLQRD